MGLWGNGVDGHDFMVKFGELLKTLGLQLPPPEEVVRVGSGGFNHLRIWLEL